MNERMAAWINWLRRRVDQVVIFAQAILLAIVVLFFWLEQQVPPPQLPQPSMSMISPTPAFWPPFARAFSHAKDLESVLRYGALLDFNPFDPRRPNPQELLTRLDRMYQRAQTAFDQGDLDTAEQLGKQIIVQLPSHQQTIELMRRILERKRELEKVTPTPSP